MEIYTPQDIKILVVDDMPQNIDVVTELLQKEGYKVFIATSGEKAIKRAEKILPDLILLDINMPGIDGFETCKILKANDDIKNIPVIFLTALADTQNIIKGFEIGAVDYVTKPFKVEEILTRIKFHLERTKLQTELKKEIATKNKFFSIVAHDLKNPFISMIGLSQILMDDFDNMEKSEIMELLEEVYASADNTFKFLENLLQWSRSQLGTMKVTPILFSISNLASDLNTLFAPMAKMKKIKLFSEINDEIFIVADQGMVQTVLRNLITNAIKFTPEGGSIKISAFVTDDKVKISVTDTGIGIPEDKLERVFDVTQTYTTKGTNDEEGSGLGLVLCKEFIEKNNGTISVTSTVDVGSTFEVMLPYDIEAAESLEKFS